MIASVVSQQPDALLPPAILQAGLIDAIANYFNRLRQGPYGLWDEIFELMLIGIIVYATMRFLQGTRGARLLKSFGLILVSSFLVVRLVAEKLELDRVIFLYPYFVGGVIITTLVAFQPEIRRGLIRIGETRWLRFWSKEHAKIIEPIVTAVTRMSHEKIGAVIAVQREVGLDAIVETGVFLDAEVSAELLETIFWPGSALHDMGVVIQRSRIAGALCQFPIAESGELALSLGSRHRAALGLSQECDALIVVVSEETGAISVAENGVLHRPLTPDALRARLIAGLTSGINKSTSGDEETLPDAEPTETKADTDEQVAPVGAGAEAKV